MSARYAIAVHGGAGPAAPDDDAELAKAGCLAAARAGSQVLAAGGSALDAAVAAVVALEDNPAFNAGTGSCLNEEGEVEMDASVMAGDVLGGGAVALVRTVKNPISLARLVMTKTRHVLLTSDGAEKFADEMHVEMASREFAEIEFIGQIAKRMDAGVGIIDVKSYYIETPENVADRVRLCQIVCSSSVFVRVSCCWSCCSSPPWSSSLPRSPCSWPPWRRVPHRRRPPRRTSSTSPPSRSCGRRSRSPSSTTGSGSRPASSR